MYFSSLTTSVLAISLVWGSAVGKDSYVRIELVPDEATVNGACTHGFKQSLTGQFSSWVSHGAAIQLGEDDRFLDEDLSFQMTYDRDVHAHTRKRGLRRTQQQDESQQQDEEEEPKKQQTKGNDISSDCSKCSTTTGQCYTSCGSCGSLCSDPVIVAGNSSLVRSRIMREMEIEEQSRDKPAGERHLACAIPRACDSCCVASTYCYNRCAACILCGNIIYEGNSTAPPGRRDLLLAPTPADSLAEELTFEFGVSEWTQYAAQKWVAANDKTGCMGDPKKLLAVVTLEGR